MALARLSCAWQNFPGAPGVTQLYGDSPTMQPMCDAARAFFFAVQGLLPAGLTITVPNSGDIIDETTGTITGSWVVGTAPPLVTATGTGAYAGNAGAVVHWLTQTVAKGRRVRGRTFLVPIVGNAYDSTGSLTPATVTTITNAANALVSSVSGGMQVWHRPVYAVPKTTPPTLVTPGSKATVTTTRVPDLAVSLRSRRI